MSASHELNVVIQTHEPSPKLAQGRVTQIQWSKTESLHKALRAGGATWGMAVVTAFIPIAHFFLVPLFLFLGPFVFWLSLGVKGTLEGGKGLCPACQKAIVISKGSIRWPKKTECDHCHSTLLINPEG